MARARRRARDCIVIAPRASKQPSAPTPWATFASGGVERRADGGSQGASWERSVAVAHARGRRPRRVCFGVIAAQRLAEHARSCSVTITTRKPSCLPPGAVRPPAAWNRRHGGVHDRPRRRSATQHSAAALRECRSARRAALTGADATSAPRTSTQQRRGDSKRRVEVASAPPRSLSIKSRRTSLDRQQLVMPRRADSLKQSQLAAGSGAIPTASDDRHVDHNSKPWTRHSASAAA
jgi:hypothetical protein